MMKNFILLHEIDTNRTAGINVNEIVCFVIGTNSKSSDIYIKGDEGTIIRVNEKPADIIKKIGDSRKFVLVHTQRSNSELGIPQDIIKTLRRSEDDVMTLVSITDLNFADFEVNETVTSIVGMLNS